MKEKIILIGVLVIFLSCSYNDELNSNDESNLDSMTILMKSNFSLTNNCLDTHTDDINDNISFLHNNGGGTLILDNGLHLINKQIFLQSNVNLQINGNLEKVDCASNFYLIKIQNVENVRIYGNNISQLKNITVSHNDNAIYIGESYNIDLSQFSLIGDINDSATGITVFNSSNINIKNVNVSNFKNKGISVTGNNQSNIVISENNISGSNSSTGAGISISDSVGKVEYSEISSNYIDSCRIGITINKSKYISILNNSCVNNSMTGIALDGLEIASGDGAQNCIVSNNFIIGNGYSRQDCGSLEYAGIYLGNGADKNIIAENIIRDNGYGIAYNQANEVSETNSSYNNTITNNQIILNRWRGMRFKKMKRAIITGNEIIQNVIGGIEFEEMNIEEQIFTNNNLVLNGTYGIIFNNCDQVNLIPLEDENILAGNGIYDTDYPCVNCYPICN